MKTLVALFLSLALSASVSARTDDGDLKAIEHAFREDVEHVTLSQLTDLLADEYVSTDQQGNKADKAETLKLFKNAKEKGITFPPVKLKDLQITVTGSTAVVVGAYTLNSDATAEHAFTDAFKKNQKGWQLVSSKEGLK